MLKFSWGDNRRFNSAASRGKELFGGRVQRVSINAGFTCPNRDGSIGFGGCTFCNNKAFTPSYCQPTVSITDQINEGIAFLDKRYKKPEIYVAYFQSYTNTYASFNVLKELYGEALAHPAIKGIAIGTRPDCVDDQKLDFIARLSKENIVSIEYGVESCLDKTLLRVNRRHTFEDSIRAINKSAERGLHTGIHLIFGLPGETREEMLAQAAIVSKLSINTIKFHQLQIVKGSPMEKEYARYPERFNPFDLEEYVDLAVSFIERLKPEISIERLSGEVPPAFNKGKSWGLRTDQVLNLIEKELERRDTWQGRIIG